MMFGDVKCEYRDYKHPQGKNCQTRTEETFKQREHRRLPVTALQNANVAIQQNERHFAFAIPCAHRLPVAHMSLMFISLCGPSIELWEPMPQVKSWLTLNHRSAASTQGPSSYTGKPTDQISSLVSNRYGRHAAHSELFNVCVFKLCFGFCWI